MPKFIKTQAAIALHRQQIELNGGNPGLRSLHLLESAMSQPSVTYLGNFLHETIFDKAAAYLFHINKNHPFRDGNKRTSLVVTLLFLKINNYEITTKTKDLEKLTKETAEGIIDKSEISRLLKSYYFHSKLSG